MIRLRVFDQAFMVTRPTLQKPCLFQTRVEDESQLQERSAHPVLASDWVLLFVFVFDATLQLFPCCLLL